jgi:ferredoxin
LKVKVKPGICQGHARCAALAPNFFELDDLGFVAFEEKQLSAGDEAIVRRAVRACPERALILEEDD